MFDKDLLNTPLSYGGKIGIITDCFTNEDYKSYIVFKSAESIIRSPLVPCDDEFIPFMDDLVKIISVSDFTSDIAEKRTKAKRIYRESVANGIEKFKNHDGEFLVTAFNVQGKEPYILHFRNEDRLLTESAIGQLTLSYHPRIYTTVEKETAVLLAESYYSNTTENVLARLSSFRDEVLNGRIAKLN